MDLVVSSTVDQNVQKSLQAYEIKNSCSPARTVSRTVVESYSHFKLIKNNLHLSGGTVDLMIGTDFAQAFSGMLVIPGKSREPISKLNCGWFVIGTLASQHNQLSGGVSSVVAETVSVLEDLKKLLAKNLMGVRPNEICTC